MPDSADNRKLLGVTVMPEYLQNEGVDAVLDRLAAVGVNAVTTSPYVMEPADEKTGGREPPDDAGAGSVRLLDRPLWGRRELFVRTAPSFEPDLKLYDGLRYQPAPPTDLTRREGKVVADFIRAAQSRHMKVYLQVQAAIPPGYRVQFGGPTDDDKPLLPDGRVPPRRLAKNGSLASPHIRDYTHALLRDLCRAYPDIDGLRVDWPEYPPYFLDDVFLDFSPHAKAAAERLGIDFGRMQHAVGALYRKLHGGLTSDDLRPWTDRDGGRHVLLRFLANHAAIADWLRLKAQLVEELLAGFRKTIDGAGGKKKELVPNAFPPPFTLASGFDFSRVGKHVDACSVKLYTMHWPMMMRFYGDALRTANPQALEQQIVSALVAWFDTIDYGAPNRLEIIRYPESNEPHPVGNLAQLRKIKQAQQEAGSLPIYALAHGYGPLEDFQKRLGVARMSTEHGVWINRYGYLSNEKIKSIANVFRKP
jgi:hypothetical protein